MAPCPIETSACVHTPHVCTHVHTHVPGVPKTSHISLLRRRPARWRGPREPALAVLRRVLGPALRDLRQRERRNGRASILPDVRHAVRAVPRRELLAAAQDGRAERNFFVNISKHADGERQGLVPI